MFSNTFRAWAATSSPPDDVAGRVGRHAARDEEQIADPDSVGVVADRLPQPGKPDLLAIRHGAPLVGDGMTVSGAARRMSDTWGSPRTRRSGGSSRLAAGAFALGPRALAVTPRRLRSRLDAAACAAPSRISWSRRPTRVGSTQAAPTRKGSFVTAFAASATRTPPAAKSAATGRRIKIPGFTRTSVSRTNATTATMITVG